MVSVVVLWLRRSPSVAGPARSDRELDADPADVVRGLGEQRHRVGTQPLARRSGCRAAGAQQRQQRASAPVPELAAGQPAVERSRAGHLFAQSIRGRSPARHRRRHARTVALSQFTRVYRWSPLAPLALGTIAK